MFTDHILRGVRSDEWRMYQGRIDLRKLPVRRWKSSRIGVEYSSGWARFIDADTSDYINSTVRVHYESGFVPPERRRSGQRRKPEQRLTKQDRQKARDTLFADCIWRVGSSSNQRSNDFPCSHTTLETLQWIRNDWHEASFCDESSPKPEQRPNSSIVTLGNVELPKTARIIRRHHGSVISGHPTARRGAPPRFERDAGDPELLVKSSRLKRL
jgi:hypothetical protein